MVKGLRDDGKGFDNTFLGGFECSLRGARNSEAILDALAAEVNDKSSKIFVVGKVLQLLRSKWNRASSAVGRARGLSSIGWHGS
jgi:hypothetical protein